MVTKHCQTLPALLAACLIQGAALAGQAESASPQRPERITISGDVSFAPILFLDAQGKPSGSTADLLHLWSERTGIKVDFVLTEWTKAIQMVRDGEADAVAEILHSPARSEFLDFSQPYQEISSYIFFHESVGYIEGIHDLTAFRVGVLSGDYLESYLRANAPGIDLVTYPTTDEMVSAALAGDIRVFASYIPVAPFVLARLGSDQRFRHTETPLYTDRFRLAVKKGNSTLLQLMNEGLSSITNEERKEILERWAGAPVDASAPRPHDDEPRQLVIALDDNYPPISFLDADGRPRGTAVDMWQLWSRKTGVDVELRLVPWLEMMDTLDKGEADALGDLFYSTERAKTLDFSRPYQRMSAYIYFHESLGGVRGLNDLAGFEVGVLDGDYALEYTRKAAPWLDFKLYPSYGALVDAARNGEFRVFIAEEQVVSFLLARSAQELQFRRTHSPLYSDSMRVAVKKGDVATLDLVNRGLSEISQEEMRRILERWSGVSVGSRIPWRWVVAAALALVCCVGAVALWNAQLRVKIASATQALRGSEERYRTIFDSVGDAIFIQDLENGAIVDVNAKMCDLFGYTREEARGLDIEALGQGEPPYSRDDAMRWLRTAAAGEPQIFEWWARRKSGQLFWVEISIRRARIADDECLLVAVRDITERKLAEETLRRERDFSNTIIQASSAFFVAIDPEGRTISMNSSMLAATGYSLEEVQGKDYISQFILDEERAGLHNLILAMAHQEQQVFYRNHVLAKDGRALLVEWHVHAVFDENREYDFLFGIGIDMTERVRAEEERARLAKAVEQAAEGIIIGDVFGTIRYVNPAFERLTGYSRDEAIGQDISMLRDSRTGEGLYREMADKIRRGELWSGHLASTRKDGAQIEEEVTVSPMRDDTGQVSSFVALMRDVTREVELEGRLRQAQKLEAIGTLAGGIAHDFNNLLSPILGFTELVKDELPEDNPLREDLDEVIKVSNRAKDLVQQILTFSRQAETQRRPIQVQQSIAEAIKLLRATIPSTIEMTSSISTDCGLVHADPIQIHQVVVNLGTNAFHAMQDTGGTLGINLESICVDHGLAAKHTRLAEGKKYLRIEVSDTGHGMDSATQQRIFDPFFTTKEQGKGTGLGLATVHGIVMDLEGEISVRSELGKGSTFLVYLPEFEIQAPPPEVSDEPIPSGNGQRILLVDDERTILDLAKRLMSRLGYQVTAFSASTEVLDVFRDDPHGYDLIVTDQTMPKMTGLELAAHVKSIRPDMPILVVTGLSENITAERVRDAGIFQVIKKPFTRREIAKAIHQALCT